jgi:hypothetical protein
LQKLVSSPSSYESFPIVGPKTAAELAEYVKHPEPPLAERTWIEEQLFTFKIKPHKAKSDLDWDLLLRVNLAALSDFSRVDLGYAFGRLMRENKFFPDVSEIVTLAKYAQWQREFRKHQANALIMKHNHLWREPIPEDQLCTPEDIARIKAEVAAEFPSNRDETK